MNQNVINLDQAADLGIPAKHPLILLWTKLSPPNSTKFVYWYPIRAFPLELLRIPFRMVSVVTCRSSAVSKFIPLSRSKPATVKEC
jgi:hypothetical protein